MSHGTLALPRATAPDRRIRMNVGDRALRLHVAPGVHPPDPYAPAFASAMGSPRGASVLDMGCGAGGYGLALAARGARQVVLTDTDAAAVACALANAARNGLSPVEGRVGSLFAPVRGERFDVVVTSLPQLPAPRRVIATRWGGPDGLDFLRRLAARALRHLAPGGRMYVLVTDWAWPESVAPIFERRGFAMKRVARVERAFQPIEYERIAPGLFDYLHRRAESRRAAYRRSGSWCYLGVSLFQATRPDG